MILNFNNIQVNQARYQKRFDMFFDDKLNFREHLKYTTTKINKPIRLLSKLQLILPRRTFSVSKEVRVIESLSFREMGLKQRK